MLKTIITLCIVICVAQSDVINAAEIRLRKDATATGPVLLLSDVAEILSPDASEVAALSNLELGPVSATGKQVIRLRDVQDRLFVQGVKLTQHDFSGSAQTTIGIKSEAVKQRPLERSAINLATTAVCEAVARYLKQTTGSDEGWQVEVDLTADQARAVNAATDSLTAQGKQSTSVGQQPFTIVLGGAKQRTQFEVMATITLPPSIVVAVNSIAKGDMLRASDLQVQRLKPGAVRKDGFETIEQIVGREAARSIAAGQPLDATYVRLPLMVRRGDVVELYARSGGVQVHTRARARDEGSVGDLINVELLSNRRALLARVCGLQEVEILGAAPSVR